MIIQNVCVIDDDEQARTAIARLLRSQGYDVTTYQSADEYLREEIADRPGCIVSDLRLPGMDGLDLFGALHSSGRLTPMVFVSAYTDVPASVRAIKNGAVDFLVKPVEEDALFHSVRRALALDEEIRQQKSEEYSLRARLEQLTARERQVFALVVAGSLNKQIAGQLGISEQTVKVHRGRVMKKMRVRSLAELVHIAERMGGIPMPPVSPPPAAEVLRVG
jgi:RNA polymerase sigma factor (sigma-70 family)